MTKTFVISRRKTPQPRMATPSASFPPSPAAAVATPVVPSVVAEPLDCLSLLLAVWSGRPLRRALFRFASRAFPLPFFDILEESRRAGKRNGYHHSSAARKKAGCHAFEGRNSSL